MHKVDPQLISIPPLCLYVPGDAYKSMDLETISLLIDWLVYYNPPTRMNLLVPWQVSQWNDVSNFCANYTVFSQKCAGDCFTCCKRSTTVDIHEYRLRSGLAYGTLAQLLSHIFETGNQVMILKMIKNR